MVRQKVNRDMSDEMTIEGFVFSPLKCAITSLVVVLSGGLFLILLTWRADIKLNCVYQSVPLHMAKKVLLKDRFNQIFEEDVLLSSDGMGPRGRRMSSLSASSNNRFFLNKKIKYVWERSSMSFVRLSNLDADMRQSEFHKSVEGLGQLTVNDRLKEYGDNVIKISVPPILYLVFHEALNPFYLFQAYTVILWSIQMYWKFAVIIAVTSVVSVTVSVWETRKQNRNLREKMRSESRVITRRNGIQTEVSSTELVPGDVLLLPVSGGVLMECDAVLVEGSCVVNEAMLTGESIPITKIAVPNEESTVFQYDLQRQHVVFCGTEIMQGKAGQGSNFCKAIVIRTGFMTTKGELVRSILFPPPLDFKFHSDFLKSIYVFLFLGLIGMAYSLYMWISNGGTLEECLLNSLDILTFVVPPILPAALTANNAFAQKRLEKHGVFCLHSKHISLCGGIDVVAFDKTGTLTEDTLDLAGVCESREGRFSDSLQSDPTKLGLESRLVQAMASCHSLIKLRGELTGNPLDVKLFEAIGWELKEQSGSAVVNPDYGLITQLLVSPPKSLGHSLNKSTSSMSSSNLELAVLKTYPFDSSVQRMTVVAKRKGGVHFEVFLKGAPEKVASFCKPDTIPSEFLSVLQRYTRQGLRVIAAAHKTLSPHLSLKEVEAMARQDLESQSDFLGLIVMQNLLKLETYDAIRELHDADISTVMVTGDNILTAISVGRECSMVRSDQSIIRVTADLEGKHRRLGCASVNQQQLNINYELEENDKTKHPMHHEMRSYVFAMDGPTFGLIREHDRVLLDRLVQRGKIFARMLPEQKIHLIEALKQLGRQVVMCGDGCNDCGALKTAHAGISLSMAEASVAAPFTSRNVNISCVPYLIREGRATMVSAFASFKFGVAFCFTQLIAVLMVFYIGTEPSDNQYLVVDIIYGAVPIIMIGNCGPFGRLVKQKPSRHLLSFLPLFSIISFLIFQLVAYLAAWIYVQSQTWWVPYQFEAGLWPPNPSYEQTTIFLMSCAASTIAGVVFSKAAPYRLPLYTNGAMLVWTTMAVLGTVFMTLFRHEAFISPMNFKLPPTIDTSLVILGLMAINLIFCILWEKYFLDTICFGKLLPWYKANMRGPNLPFEHLETELRSKSGWPPIGDGRNNEIKIAVKLDSLHPPLPDVTSSSGSKTSSLKTSLRNKWSASESVEGCEEEQMHLLASSNTETMSPFESPQKLNAQLIIEKSLGRGNFDYNDNQSNMLSKERKETQC